MSVKVGVFHPGTQHSWQTAFGFQEAGQLGWYATSVFYSPNQWPYKIEKFLPDSLAAKSRCEFRRRYSPNLDIARVRQFGIWEWLEVGARRAKKNLLAGWLNEIGNRKFGHSVIGLIQREPVDVVWGYNSSSVEVFRWAKKQGIQCVLSQTIGHPITHNEVLLAEQERHPEFFSESFVPYSQRWIDQQNEEMDLADVIVAGSEFCAGTMIECGCPADKIRVIPNGYDESIFPQQRPKRNVAVGRPVRFLFAGIIGPRKGIAYLLKAFERIPKRKVSLTLLGRSVLPERTLARYADRVCHIPQVPKSEVLPYFLEADCFVLPSLFEGSAKVLYEAWGAGLGIIESRSSGGGKLNGRNGLVLEEVSVEAIVDAILSVHADPKKLRRWQEASWDTRLEGTWAVYRERVRNLVNTGLASYCSDGWKLKKHPVAPDPGGIASG